MSDLISRQDAIDALTKTIAVNKNPNHDARVWEEGMNCALTIIGALPSAQPYTEEEIQKMQDLEFAEIEKAYEIGLREGRKTGEWILTDFPDEQTYKCSSCNEHWIFLEGTPYDNGAYFCPNCGADMRGEEE